MSIKILAMRVTRDWMTKERERALQILPQIRRDRLTKLKRHEKQRESIAAWLLLYYGLQKRYDWNAFPAIDLTALGKPFFPNYPSVQFNMSHTDGAVLVGIGDTALGVDIEKIRPVGERLKNKMGEGTSDYEFLRNWVRLEACGKRDGTGVLPHLNATIFLHRDEGYREMNVFEGYVAGVALLRGVETSTVQMVEQEEIGAFLRNKNK